MGFALTPTEALLERVARLHFVDNRTQAEIANDLQVIELYRSQSSKHISGADPLKPLAQATVNRLLYRARALGVVAASVDSAFAVEMAKDLPLSRELRDAFGLEDCTVLRPAQGSASLRAGAQPVDSKTAIQNEDDRLILGLANHAARDFRQSLSSGSHVIVGGGRTPVWLARAVRRSPPSRTGLAFTPLSGRLWLEDWKTADADIMERPLDADDAVYILSEAFQDEPGGRFSQINQPLYMPSVPDAERVCEHHSALRRDGTWNWNLPEGSKALVGVGSLASSSHRLQVFLRKFEEGNAQATKSYLHSAQADLTAILRACGAIIPPPGDIGNRLFACVPLPQADGALPEQNADVMATLATVADMIGQLNQRAVVMQWLHLRRTRHVQVIGGGPTKLVPLWTILLASFFDVQARASREVPARDESAPIVTDVVVDSGTAAALLGAVRIVRSSRQLLAWYRQATQLVGLSIG